MEEVCDVCQNVEGPRERRVEAGAVGRGCQARGGVLTLHGVTREDLAGREPRVKPVPLSLHPFVFPFICAAITREGQLRRPLQNSP